MLPANGLESNNNRIIEEFLNHTIKLHEHDFMLIRNEKEQMSMIICSICGLVYCEKCGKLVAICHKNYMQHNTYN